MNSNRIYRFATSRLLLDEWHSLDDVVIPPADLVLAVQKILTPNVTAALPPPWQGEYSEERAKQWIQDRDKEGIALLVTEKPSYTPVGLVILFTENDADYRLGYMLRESAWGRGLASELIAGLNVWCEQNAIRSVTGGVARGNVASRRVLEKNSYVINPDTENAPEQLFTLMLNSRD